MTQIVNGLAATPTRRALVRAVNAGGGRIYYEPPAKAAFDRQSGMRVTDKLRDLLGADWIRVRHDDEPLLPGESQHLIHYGLTDYGRAVLRGEQ